MNHELFSQSLFFHPHNQFFFMVACNDNYQDRRHQSPNFVDGKFVNAKKRDKSLGSFLKMVRSTEYAQWPDWIESEYKTIANQRVEGAEVHITHINHSTLLIQTQGFNILTDPIWSKRCSPFPWAGPARVRNPGVRFEDLPPIDVVLISHDHYDHLDKPTIKRLIARDDPTFFVGLGVGTRFSNKNNVHELDWWEFGVFNDDLKVHFVPVQHFSGRGIMDRNSTLWGGFVLDIKGRYIYFGGDSGYADHFKQTYEKFGPMDIAMIPFGAYEPRWFMSYAHINPEEAVQAHVDLRAQKSIGIHYGTFQLTAEAIDAPLKELDGALEKMNISRDNFLTPEFGDTLVFN